MSSIAIESVVPSVSASVEGSVTGAPAVVLRLEGLALLVAATLAFGAWGGAWTWFVGLLLVPDLSLLGYLANARVGAVVYNAGHSLLGPALLLALGAATGGSTWTLGAFVWAAHIGMDRAFGYGLKYARGFRSTHLGAA